MTIESQETFFRPPEHGRHDWTVPITLYKLCRKPLRRSSGSCVFIPIRNMQFLAIIDTEEIVFVDSQTYMVHGGVGGRVILLSWRLAPANSLESLTQPVPCTVIHYRPDLSDVQRRLVGEFTRALELVEYRSPEQQSTGAPRILPFGKK